MTIATILAPFTRGGIIRRAPLLIDNHFDLFYYFLSTIGGNSHDHYQLCRSLTPVPLRQARGNCHRSGAHEFRDLLKEIGARGPITIRPKQRYYGV
jgi:hypothetical protein